MNHGKGAGRIALAVILAAAVLAGSGCGGKEARKERSLERGQELLAERDYAKARIEFRNALQIDPEDAQAYALLGEAAENLGNYEEAVKAYRLALTNDPGQVRARARLGRIMVFSGVPDQALELLEEGLAQSPRSADLLAIRAAARLQSGEVDAALKDAAEALAIEPNHSDAVALLASKAWRDGRREEALAQLDAAIRAKPEDIMLRSMLVEMLLTAERPAEAEEQLKQLVRLQPEVQAHRYRLAQLYASQKKTDAAIATLREAIAARPEDVDAKLTLANLLASQRSFEEAEKLLLDYVAAAPKNLDFRLGLGRFYEANAHPEQAEAAYRAVIEDAGDRAAGVAARTRIASLKVRSGKLDEASALLEEVLAKNPSDGEALVMRAQMAIQRGDTDAAVGDLRTALRDQPNNILLVVQLAQAYIRAGNLDLAEQALRQAVQANPRDTKARLALAQFLVNKGEAATARPVLERLVADEPNNAEALEGLARLEMILNDPAAALQRATALQTVQSRSASGYYLAGMAMRAQGKNAEARVALERAVAVDPAAVEPLVELVRLDMSENQGERALSRLDDWIAREPENSMLLNLRGDLLIALQRPRDAVASYEDASELTPRWSQPYRGRAVALTAAGEPAKAIEALEAGLAATGNSPDIALDLGAMYVRAGRWSDAIILEEKALERNPRDSRAANNLAMLLANHRKEPASLERAAKLAEQFKDSTNPAFLDTYGWVLFRRGQYAEAVAALQRASDMLPDAPELRYHLGMAQYKAGMREDARRNLMRATEDGQSYFGLEEARSVLATLN